MRYDSRSDLIYPFEWFMMRFDSQNHCLYTFKWFICVVLDGWIFILVTPKWTASNFLFIIIIRLANVLLDCNSNLKIIETLAIYFVQFGNFNPLLTLLITLVLNRNNIFTLCVRVLVLHQLSSCSEFVWIYTFLISVMWDHQGRGTIFSHNEELVIFSPNRLNLGGARCSVCASWISSCTRRVCFQFTDPIKAPGFSEGIHALQILLSASKGNKGYLKGCIVDYKGKARGPENMFFHSVTSLDWM